MSCRLFVRLVIAAAVTCATAVVAPAAGAEPADNPCDLAVTFLCRLVPMAPDLDGDVDLTKQQPGDGSGLLLPESSPPADPCSAGCI